MRTTLTTAWGILGVAATFVEAIARLGARAFQTVDRGLSPLHWLALVATVAFFGYFEGHRALQRRYAPYVAGRARENAARPFSVVRLLLAPLFAAGLVGGTARQLGRAWLGVALIVAAVFAVRMLPDPWRGIVDAGVAAALGWGFFALLWTLRGTSRASRP